MLIFLLRDVAEDGVSGSSFDEDVLVRNKASLADFDTVLGRGPMGFDACTSTF